LPGEPVERREENKKNLKCLNLVPKRMEMRMSFVVIGKMKTLEMREK
jgi:hypothetical protein